MNTSVEFESDLFVPFLPDESQVNPGIYGAELAFWLSRKLSGHDIVTTYPASEDWGWFLEYFVDGYEYTLCCSNIGDVPLRWRCFLRSQSLGLFSRKKHR